jgi:hypothetical protein
VVRIDQEREVHPKGFDAALPIYRVVGLGGDHDLSLPEQGILLAPLAQEIPVRFALLEGKDVIDHFCEARLWAGSLHGAKLRSADPVAEMSDVRIELLDENGSALPGACYAKVVEGSETGGGSFTVRFTTHSEPLHALLGGHEPGPAPPDESARGGPQQLLDLLE